MKDIKSFFSFLILSLPFSAFFLFLPSPVSKESNKTVKEGIN